MIHMLKFIFNLFFRRNTKCCIYFLCRGSEIHFFHMQIYIIIQKLYLEKNLSAMYSYYFYMYYMYFFILFVLS